MYRSHDRPDGLIYLLIGGPLAVTWGLKVLQKKRLVENTPTSKVRSAAMGRVELAGMAKPCKPQKAPFSGMTCCWWECQVQELQTSGRNSRWVTISRKGCMDFFYLDDLTGQVLVNPYGAELHVLTITHDLSSSTRTQMAPVLNGWGINDMSWFGGTKRLRVQERLIPDCAPVYVMGDLVSVGTHLDDRQARLTERLRAIKANPAKMAAADTNHDGTVDAEEWDAFRIQQEEDFLRDERTRQTQMPTQTMMLIQASANGPFIVSTGTEGSLVGAWTWLAPLGLFGGVAVSAIGVWWALAVGWSPIIIVGLLGVGVAFGIFLKQLPFGIGGN